MTSLRQLLPDIAPQLPDVAVQGLKLDSRQVTHGDCFVAVQGHQVDGRKFIRSAVDAGAVVVLQQANSFSIDSEQGIPLISVPDLAMQLSAIAGRFYGQPCERMKVVGVTGTNGKTTVTHLLAQLYDNLGQAAAVMGTLGSGFINSLLPEKNTTPDALTVQQRLAGLAHEGAQVTAMEVSSHALVQGRVQALQFSAVVATNISRDHLDYHGSMESYAAAKQDLFTRYAAPIKVVNFDDPVVAQWFQDSPEFIGFSLNQAHLGKPQVLVASDVQYHDAGADFTVHWQGQSQAVRSPLLGAFNVANVLAASAVLVKDGISLAQLAQVIPTLKPIAGRMETFTCAGQPLAIVDYAHTPDALEQVLKAARRHCKGKLWCVFGCGGDRDRGKRPQMGQVASQYADIVVVTDDNPRTEAPLQIIADIVSGAVGQARMIEHPGRKSAVLFSLAEASADDVVVMAGKGHEDYQVVGMQTLDYNERDVVAGFMREAAL